MEPRGWSLNSGIQRVCGFLSHQVPGQEHRSPLTVTHQGTGGTKAIATSGPGTCGIWIQNRRHGPYQSSHSEILTPWARDGQHAYLGTSGTHCVPPRTLAQAPHGASHVSSCQGGAREAKSALNPGVHASWSLWTLCTYHKERIVKDF